jgi:hypothetical protein
MLCIRRQHHDVNEKTPGPADKSGPLRNSGKERPTSYLQSIVQRNTKAINKSETKDDDNEGHGRASL